MTLAPVDATYAQALANQKMVALTDQQRALSRSDDLISQLQACAVLLIATPMHTYLLLYQFNGEPRSHSLELHQPSLSIPDAAMHLLQLHFGGGQNSLMMPKATARPEEVLQQAVLVGLTRIQVIAQAQQVSHRLGSLITSSGPSEGALSHP